MNNNMVSNDIRNEKKSNSKLVVILVLIVTLLAGGLFYFTKIYQRKPGNTVVEESGKKRLQDDFYNNINYDLLTKVSIPDDSGSWSLVYDATKTIYSRTQEISSEILSDPNYQNKNIDNITEIYNDYQSRNKLGFSELKPYFDMIDKAQTIEEYNKVLLTIYEDLNVNVLFEITKTMDIDNSDKNVLFFDVIDNYQLFTDSMYASFKEIYEDFIGKCLSSIGYDKTTIETFIQKNQEYSQTVQSKSINIDALHDMSEVWNKYTLEQINNEIKNIPIQGLLEKLGIADMEYYVIFDLGQYKAVDEYYNLDNLSFFKDLTKYKIVMMSYQFTTEDNLKEYVNFYNKMSGTKLTMDDFKQFLENEIKTSYIQDEIEQRYEKKYFTDEDKKIVSDLVEEVIKEYKEVINKADWMEDSTKASAIKKLDNMTVNIGYQPKEKVEMIQYIPKSQGGTLISNVIHENRFSLSKFKEEFDNETDLGISTLDVNAFYNARDNSINFLAGFKEIYANEEEYYRKLGFFGTVVAHEISHAFDVSGSNYDETGKYNNWWTENDKKKYEELTKKIEDYYSTYEVNGFKVNGQKTLGENIADLGAMKTIISICEKKGATKEDYKNFFEAYANLWAEKNNRKYLETVILKDKHAPSKVRVNAVLSSMDKFYEVYDIKEGDKMFVPKDKRVSLW